MSANVPDDAKTQDASGGGPVPFNAFLTTSHPLAVALADNLLSRAEAWLEGRQRQMKERDREGTRTMLRAILANLIRAAAEGADPPAFGVSIRAARAAQTRYDRKGFTGLPALLEGLAANVDGFALSKSRRKGQPSVFGLCGPMAATFGLFAFKAEDVEQEPGETVWLLRDDGRPARYDETPEAKRLRDELETINRAIRGAGLGVVPDGGPVVLTGLRELRRRFAGRFDLGGELVGGFWQGLEPARRRAVRINGEAVGHIAFADLTTRLAYVAAGAEPPKGELPAAAPGFTRADHREGLRLTLLAMLASASPLLRLPKDAKGLLPPRATVGGVRAAILTACPELEPVLECGAMPRVDFIASGVMVASLLGMVQAGVVALPVDGDGFLFPRSKADVVAKAMREGAKAAAGFELPVNRNTPY